MIFPRTLIHALKLAPGRALGLANSSETWLVVRKRRIIFLVEAVGLAALFYTIWLAHVTIRQTQEGLDLARQGNAQNQHGLDLAREANAQNRESIELTRKSLEQAERSLELAIEQTSAAVHPSLSVSSVLRTSGRNPDYFEWEIWNKSSNYAKNARTRCYRCDPWGLPYEVPPDFQKIDLLLNSSLTVAGAESHETGDGQFSWGEDRSPALIEVEYHDSLGKWFVGRWLVVEGKIRSQGEQPIDGPTPIPDEKSVPGR